MTTRFGWCFGPEGAIGDHDSCPYELGADGAILRCGCACHTGASDHDFALQGWENGTSSKCPEPVRPDPGRRPHPAKEL